MFLPEKIRQALTNIDLSFLYEIRLRLGFPIKINLNNNIYYLSRCGTSSSVENAIVCDLTDIRYIIDYSTERSIYAFSDRIKDGFLTIDNGVRIGICGECVYDDSILKTIKNFTSLNIRIPHEVYGSSDILVNYVLENNVVNNSLIISPPFLGKTTLLKDLARKFNKLNKDSILIIDERGEFESIKGENIDAIKYSNKYYAFNYAVRSMSPSLVITDELISESDWKCAYNVVCSGIKIVASCHSDSLTNLKNKEFFNKKIFDKYILLSKDAFGKIDSVYNKDFQLV